MITGTSVVDVHSVDYVKMYRRRILWADGGD